MTNTKKLLLYFPASESAMFLKQSLNRVDLHRALCLYNAAPQHCAPSPFQLLVLGYFWGGDICRVNAVGEEQVESRVTSPAALQSCRTAPGNPQDPPSAAGHYPNPKHHILYWQRITCCSTVFYGAQIDSVFVAQINLLVLVVIFLQIPRLPWCNAAEQILLQV